jgi:tetratricopeptide (TPR) repeat protein
MPEAGAADDACAITGKSCAVSAIWTKRGRLRIDERHLAILHRHTFAAAVMKRQYMEELTARTIAHYHQMAHKHLKSPPDPLVAPIAISFLEKALTLDPHHIETQLALARVWHRLGKTDEALHWCERALEIDPGSVAVQFHLCMMQIPVLCENAAEAADRRRNYERYLQQLVEFVDMSRKWTTAEAVEMIGVAKPFYLAYAAEDDHTLQQRYGAFVCSLLAARYPQWCAAPAVLPPMGRRTFIP